MSELSAQNALLIMWVGFAVLALVGVVAVLVWAVRARQFSDQDRARFLPLYADKPLEEPALTGTRAGSGTTAEGGEKHVSN